MDHGRSPQTNSSKPLDSKSSTSETPSHTTTNIATKPIRSRSNSPVPNPYPKNSSHTESPSYPPSRNSRFDPYFSRPSRERDDRRDREREDRFRRRNDRELHREDRPLPPPHGPNHPFVPSFYPHNRRAGADFEENKRLGGVGSNSSMSAFANRRNNTNGPPPIVISRDPTSGNVLMRSGGADIAPMDIVFPGMVDREGRPKHSEGFGGSRDSRGRASMFPSTAFEKMNRAPSGSSIRDNGGRNMPYRDFRSGDFSYFTRHMDNRDHLTRGPNPFPGIRDRERDRNRDRERWERERNRERNRGRERWESERPRERERSDIATGRFEQGDTYRPGDGYRDYRRDSNPMPGKKEGNEPYHGSHGSATPDRRSSSVDSTRSTEKRRIAGGRDTRTNSIDSTTQSLDENSHTDPPIASTSGAYGKRVRENSPSSEVSSSSILPEESHDLQQANENDLRDEKRRRVYSSPQDDPDGEPRDILREKSLESPVGDNQESNRHPSKDHKTRAFESQDIPGRRASTVIYTDQNYVNKCTKKSDKSQQTNTRNDSSPSTHYTSKPHLNDDQHLVPPVTGHNEEEYSDQLEEGEIGVSDLSDSIDDAQNEKWSRRETYTSSAKKSNLNRVEISESKPSSKSESREVTQVDQPNGNSPKLSHDYTTNTEKLDLVGDVDLETTNSIPTKDKDEQSDVKDVLLHAPNPPQGSIESPEPGEIDTVSNEIQRSDAVLESGEKEIPSSPVSSGSMATQVNITLPASEPELPHCSEPDVNTPPEVKSDTRSGSIDITELESAVKSKSDSENMVSLCDARKETDMESEISMTVLSNEVTPDINHAKSNPILDKPTALDDKSTISQNIESDKLLDNSLKDSIESKLDTNVKSNLLSEVDSGSCTGVDNVSIQSEQVKYPKCIKVKTVSSDSANVESSSNEILQHCTQPLPMDSKDEQKLSEIPPENNGEVDNTLVEQGESETSSVHTKPILTESIEALDMESNAVLTENTAIEPGEIQDEAEEEVAPSSLDSSLTQEKIFAMIDKIDSEIGRYEELLIEIRKNKQSCIESSNGSTEAQQINEVDISRENQNLEPESEPTNTSQPQLAIIELNGAHSTQVANGKPQKAKKLALHKKIYAENRMLVQANVPPSLGPIFRKFEDYPFYCENIESHKRIRSLMFNHMRHKYDSLEQKENELRQKYKQYLEAWRVRIIKLDKHKEKKKGRRYLKDELLSPSGPSNLSVSRVQRHGGPFNSDTVRSEAELLEIIQSLENEELRNPNARCLRTVATIPPMVLDPYKRELTKYDDRNNLVENPYKYYHCAGPVDEWTKDERDVFIRKYLLYPKQFGKIASFLKHKNARQCVLFYYREKKSIDFKGLITGRGKKRRQPTRKEIGKTATSGSNKSKGNALLQDIDAASRSHGIEELGDLPDSLPTFKKKARFDLDQESSLDTGLDAARPIKELTAKHQSDKLKSKIASTSLQVQESVSLVPSQTLLDTSNRISSNIPGSSIGTKEEQTVFTDKPSTHYITTVSSNADNHTDQPSEFGKLAMQQEISQNSNSKLKETPDNTISHIEQSLVHSEDSTVESSSMSPDTKSPTKLPEVNVHSSSEFTGSVNVKPKDVASVKSSDRPDRAPIEKSSDLSTEYTPLQNIAVDEASAENDTTQNAPVQKSVASGENPLSKKISSGASTQAKQLPEKSQIDEVTSVRSGAGKSPGGKSVTSKIESSVGKAAMVKPGGSENSYIRSAPHKPFGMKPHNESATGKLFIKPNKPVLGKPSVAKPGFSRNLSTKPIPVKPISGKFAPSEKEVSHKTNPLDEKKGSSSQKKAPFFQEKRTPSIQSRRELPAQEKKGLPYQAKKMLPVQEKKNSLQDKNDSPQMKKKVSPSAEKQGFIIEDKQKRPSQEKKVSPCMEKEELHSQEIKKAKMEPSLAEKEELFSQDEIDIIDEVNAAIEDILDKDSSDEEETIVEEQGTAFIAPSSGTTDHHLPNSSQSEEKSSETSLPSNSRTEVTLPKEPVQPTNITSQPVVEDFDLSLDIPSSDGEETLDQKGEAIDEDALLEEEINRALLFTSSDDDEDNDAQENKNISEETTTRSSDNWSPLEQTEFVESIRMYGKDWAKIAERIKTKNSSEVEKYYLISAERLGLAEVVKQFEENLVRLPQTQLMDNLATSVPASTTYPQVPKKDEENLVLNAESYNTKKSATNEGSTEDQASTSSASQTNSVPAEAHVATNLGIISSVGCDISKPADNECQKPVGMSSPAIVETENLLSGSTTHIQKARDNEFSTQVLDVNASTLINSKEHPSFIELLQENISMTNTALHQVPGSNEIPSFMSELTSQKPTGNTGQEERFASSNNILASAERTTTPAYSAPFASRNQEILNPQQTTPTQMHKELSTIRPESGKYGSEVNQGVHTFSESAQENPIDFRPGSMPALSSTRSPSAQIPTTKNSISEQPQASTSKSSYTQGKYSVSDMATTRMTSNKSPTMHGALEQSSSTNPVNNSPSFSQIMASPMAHSEDRLGNSSKTIPVTQKYNETAPSTIHQNVRSSQVPSLSAQVPIQARPNLLGNRKNSQETSNSTSPHNTSMASGDPMDTLRMEMPRENRSTVHQTNIASSNAHKSQQQYGITNRPNFSPQSTTFDPKLSANSNSKTDEARAQLVISSVSSNYSPAQYSNGSANVHAPVSDKSTSYYPYENQPLGNIPKPLSNPEVKPAILSGKRTPSTGGLPVSRITRIDSNKADQTKLESTLPSIAYQTNVGNQALPVYSHTNTQSPVTSVKASSSHSQSELYRDDLVREPRRQSSVSKILNYPAPPEVPVVSPTRSEFSASSKSSRMESAFFDGERQEPTPTPKPVAQRARGVTDLFSLLNAPSEETQPVKVGKNALMDWFGEDVGPASSSEQSNAPSASETKEGYFQSQYNANPTLASQAQPTISRSPYSHAQDPRSIASNSQATYSISAHELNSSAIPNRRPVDNAQISGVDPLQTARHQGSPAPLVHSQVNQPIQPQVQLLQLQSQSVTLGTSQTTSVTATAQAHNQPQNIVQSRHRSGSQGQPAIQSYNYGQHGRQLSSGHLPIQTSSHTQVPITQLISQSPILKPSRASSKSRQSKPRLPSQPQIQPQPPHTRIISHSPIQHPSSPANGQSVDGSTLPSQYAHSPLHQQPSLQSGYHAPIPHHRPSHPLIQPSPGIPHQATVYSRSQSPAMNLPSSHQSQPRRTSSPLQPLPIGHSRKPSNPSLLHSQSIQYSPHSSQLPSQPTRHSTPVPVSHSRDVSQPVFTQNPREVVSVSPQQAVFPPENLNYAQTRHSQQQAYPGSEASEGMGNFQSRRGPHPQEGYHSAVPSPIDSAQNPNIGQTLYRQTPQMASNQHTYDNRENNVGQRYLEITQPPHRSSTPLNQMAANNGAFAYPPGSIPKEQQPRALHRDSSSMLDNTPFRTGSPAILDQTSYRTASPAILDGQIRRTASPAMMDPSHYRRTTSPSVMDASQYGRRPQSPVVPLGPGYPRHPHMTMQAPSSSQGFHPMTSSPINQNPAYSSPMNPMSMPGMFPHPSGVYPQQHPPPKK